MKMPVNNSNENNEKKTNDKTKVFLIAYPCQLHENCKLLMG